MALPEWLTFGSEGWGLVYSAGVWLAVGLLLAVASFGTFALDGPVWLGGLLAGGAVSCVVAVVALMVGGR